MFSSQSEQDLGFSSLEILAISSVLSSLVYILTTDHRVKWEQQDEGDDWVGPIPPQQGGTNKKSSALAALPEKKELLDCMANNQQNPSRGCLKKGSVLS